MNSPSKSQSKSPAKGAPPTPVASVAAAKVPPFFRSIDWWTFGIAFAVVWVVYFMTLAPQVTLEDSGELTTASFWAGIPHPPGYPFWTIYTWLWTVLVPFGNVAWRVQLAEASTSAVACGVLGLMVSRGSSMLMEGLEELKGMRGKWESAICLVCGVTAGLMMGFGSSMWKESVVINRISLFGTPWLMLVLVFMMRWMYAPQQRRYLFGAMICFGICATIHQTLTLAAMGIEIGIAMCEPKLGRDLFFVNTLAWLGGLLALGANTLPELAQANAIILVIFNTVGVCSLAACIYLTVTTKGLGSEWKTVLIMAVLWLIGASFYFYEAIAGMTNPPMEWGYPRTVEGFWHALTRGQYDKINPTDVFRDFPHFWLELKMLVGGVADAFSWVFMLFALVPLFFIRRMKKRERAWIILVAGLYPFLGVLLTITLNPTPDRQMADLVKVFFVASHSLVAIMIGYGLAITAAYMATNYQKFRKWGLLAGLVLALPLAIWNLKETTARHFFGLDGTVTWGEMSHWIGQAFAKDQYGLPIYACLILIGITVAFLIGVSVYKERAPLFLTLGLFACLPVYSGLTHWFHSQQDNHWFGYWFGHDMFTPPFVGADGKLTYDAKQRDQAAKGPYGKMVYPEMARDAVLFGGTDPGRFCPTYMIFAESFIPHDCQPKQDQNFDRRDVYIITQNALADGTYLDYIRAQFNRSTQIDPPFFQNFLSGSPITSGFFHGPTRALKFLDDIFETLGAKVEFRRRTGTSWFKPEHFINIKDLAAKLQARQDPLAKFLHEKLDPKTQALLANPSDEPALRAALAKDFNTLLPGDSIYDAARFKDVALPKLIVEAQDQMNIPATVIRLNRRMLEEAYPGDIEKSLGGVYPDTEIYTPTPDDSQRCFDDYVRDAGRRLEHDQQFPNEPRQLRAGEEVNMVGDRISVGGQVSVMSINGLLTKVIFDHNRDHEFYVEESFALDWMYPYLTPFGVIMKINRHPVPEITQDIIDKDHAFWSEFSRRTIGNWITYDTSIKDICDWAARTYLRHDFAGFTGDRNFIRDDDAQKAFSKLRSSIGASVYQWRMHNPHSPEELARATKETEFALKQSFAYCPYSPEAVFHLMDLLLNSGRMDEALEILQTCHSLDPYNDQINEWIHRLDVSRTSAGMDQVHQVLSQAETAFTSGRTNDAVKLMDQLLAYPSVDAQTMVVLANHYVQLGDFAKSELAVKRLTQLDPKSSDAWYNLSVVESHRGETGDAVESLKKAVQLSAAQMAHAAADPNLAGLRSTPAYQAAFPEK